MRFLLGLVAAIAGVLAVDTDEQLSDRHRMRCAGIYGAKDKPGPHKPQIELDLSDSANAEGSVAYVIYDISDFSYLGASVTASDGRQVLKYLCDKNAVGAGLCSEDQLGTIILRPYSGSPGHMIKTERVDFPRKDPIIYDVEDTGFYCVATLPFSDTGLKYKARIHFMNAYGHLPAAQEPLMLFHGIMSICYAALLGLWVFLYVRYRRDILPVQRYITALGVVMVVDHAVLWVYLRVYNKTGVAAAGTKAFLVIVSVLGALALSSTFFLVLIVSMGYSVVFSSLGPRLKLAIALGVVLFLSATLHSLDSYALLPDDVYGTLGFFLLLPAAVSVGLFYMWTLHSLSATTTYLRQRKQHVKVRMYVLLWWILLGSALALLGFFVIVMLVQATSSFKDYVNEYWKIRWLLSDGWPNIVYFVAFALIMLLWRPNPNNRQYAMSTQLAQDEGDVQEFDIGSLNGSDDEEDAVADATAAAAEHSRAGSPVAGVHRSGTTRSSQPVFDADDASDFGGARDDDEVESDGWNRNEDRDALVSAPGGALK